MGADIVGRAAELTTVARVLDMVDGPVGLAIDGEPGIGKSTLWTAGIAAAEARGSLVLRARPASSEVRLSFAGLVDLLDPRADDAIRGLPDPQRRSIEVALYRRPAEPGSEAGLVGVALLHVIQALAAERPLVIAVDDLQWLDAPSVLALEYAVRRLRTEPVAILTACRNEVAGGRSRADLVGLLPPARVARITLGPLTVGALHHLIQAELGSSLPRPVLVRIHERSVGNPFYALELARHWLQRAHQGGRAWIDSTLPASVRELILERLAGMPKRIAGPLLVVALAGQPTVELVAEVLQRPIDDIQRDLDLAVRAGVVDWAAGRSARIGHPLLADAIADVSPAPRRRLIHRRLAAAAADPEARARHLAAADDRPDPTTAAALVEAAESAVARGASAAAVELYEAAVRCWPSDDAIGVRRVRYRLAERIFLVGDLPRAMADLQALVPTLGDDPIRPDAEILLATMVGFEGNTITARKMLEDALARTGDPTSRGRMFARLAWLHENDQEAGVAAGKAAIGLLDPDVDPQAYSFALMNVAAVELQLGRPPDHEAIDRGHEIQERARVWDFSSLPANWTKWFDDFDRSREITMTYVERARQMGDESSIAHLLCYLAELECWTGHVDRAFALADEAVDIAEQTGQRSYLSAALSRRALARAVRGDLATARIETARARDAAIAVEGPTLEALSDAVEAFIDLSAEDVAAAADHCDRAAAAVASTGMVEAPMFRFDADRIEAHVALGHGELAAILIADLDHRQTVAPRRSLAALLARCRALQAAARGDVVASLDAIDEALDAHGRVDLPLEAARSWLIAGRLRRRAGRRRAAAEALAEARARFAGVGAPMWVAMAERELGALGLAGERARRAARADGGPASAGAADAEALTPSEARIAALAASGLTNRAVAERLLISPKTVEASLGRAYQKLGIRTRAELGARLGRSGGPR